MIEDYKNWKDARESNGGDCSVSRFVTERRLAWKMMKYLSTEKTSWRLPSTRERIFTEATDKEKKRFAVPGRVQKYRAKFPLVETALIDQLQERRRRKARVSVLSIRTVARSIARIEYPQLNFRALNGWLFRFLCRHGIRYRKRKNQKAVSAEEKREKL